MQAGGHPRCCRSVCEWLVALWAVPKISENQNGWTILRTPSEDEGSVSPDSDALSSKQFPGLDNQNVHEGHSSCLFFPEKLRLRSASGGCSGRWVRLVIAVRS